MLLLRPACQIMIALLAAMLLLLIKIDVLPGYAFGVTLVTGMIVSLFTWLLVRRQ